MTEKSLEELFQEAIENANLIPKESVPTDLQLILYAYFKHSQSERNFSTNSGYEPNDLKNAFKINALMQVRQMSIDDAKRKYIEIINKLLKDKQ